FAGCARIRFASADEEGNAVEAEGDADDGIGPFGAFGRDLGPDPADPESDDERRQSGPPPGQLGAFGGKRVAPSRKRVALGRQPVAALGAAFSIGAGHDPIVARPPAAGLSLTLR